MSTWELPKKMNLIFLLEEIFHLNFMEGYLLVNSLSSIIKANTKNIITHPKKIIQPHIYFDDAILEKVLPLNIIVLQNLLYRSLIFSVENYNIVKTFQSYAKSLMKNPPKICSYCHKVIEGRIFKQNDIQQVTDLCLRVYDYIYCEAISCSNSICKNNTCSKCCISISKKYDFNYNMFSPCRYCLKFYNF